MFSLYLQFACSAKGLHVLHVQSAIHEQLNGDPRVPDCAGDRAGTADGRQLPGLLNNTTRANTNDRDDTRM